MLYHSNFANFIGKPQCEQEGAGEIQARNVQLDGF